MGKMRFTQYLSESATGDATVELHHDRPEATLVERLEVVTNLDQFRGQISTHPQEWFVLGHGLNVHPSTCSIRVVDDRDSLW